MKATEMNTPRTSPSRFAIGAYVPSIDTARKASITLFFVTLSICAATLVAMLHEPSPGLPVLSAGEKMQPSRCSMWSSGILTCSLNNPAGQPANVATTVSVTCKGKKVEDVYRETIIAENVPENGWASIVVNSEGFTLFYRGVKNELKKHREQLLAIAAGGGLSESDLTPQQQAQIARTVFDVCILEASQPVHTLAKRHNDTDLLTTLKTLFGN